MEIIWHGQNCFTVKIKKTRLVFNPYPDMGLKLPRLKADILLLSNQLSENNNVSKITPSNPQKDYFMINSPGEYEVGGVVIEGIPINIQIEGKDRSLINTVYVIRAEEMSLCHLGNIQKSLLNEKLEAINGIDIVFMPIGGKNTVAAAGASDLISQIEPKIIIPMHYKVPGLEVEIADQAAFCKQEGISANDTLDILKITKSDLPLEESKIILLASK